MLMMNVYGKATRIILAVAGCAMGAGALWGAAPELQPHYLNRVTLPVEAEAFIRGGDHADDPQSDAALITQRGNTTTGTRKTYLRFDVGELDASYFSGSAELSVIKDDWRRHDIEVWALVWEEGSGDWDPARITWNRAPANDDSVDGLADDPRNDPYAVSLGTWTAADTDGSTGVSLGFLLDLRYEYVRDGRVTLVLTGLNLGVDDGDNRRLEIAREASTLTLFPGKEPVETPVAMYLCWQRDPTATMTIQWHTEGDVFEPSVEFAWLGGDDLRKVEADSHPMVFSDRMIHTVELTGLDADTEYRFRLKDVAEGRNSPFYKFRTMPETPDRPIRIAIGGDVMMREEMMARTNRAAMHLDPDFIVWGGDLSYSDGLAEKVDREYDFFRVMMETLIAEDGRVVPVLMGIGNHEILDGRSYHRQEGGRDAYENTDEFREAIAPYYYDLFAFTGHPGYRELDFGEYMSLIFLDSDHSGPVGGVQTEWLAEILEDRMHVPHVIPVYHVPAYPSVRSLEGGTSRAIRANWSPLFERAGVRVAFEHHDHAYKRTVPIRGEEEDEKGIVYIGDGAWGVPTRPVHDAGETWYLEKSAPILHFILLTIHGDSQDIKMFDSEGKLIDHYVPRKPNPRNNR